MGTGKTISRITAVLNKTLSAEMVEALKSHGLTHFHVATGRASVLQEKRGPLALLSPGMALADDPIEILTILVAPELEEAVLNFVADKARLFEPGRGSVYSDEVTLLAAHEACRENVRGDFPAATPNVYSDLMSICCIVQRGEGGRIARVPLDTGTGVPAITFGEGTGLRDKLGLLRITIPAEKEVVTVVGARHDSDDVMEMMIDAGRLDQPGKGFIYLSPVKQGVLNTKVSRGTGAHAASIQQMIVAIDDLKGGVEWRRRESVPGKTGAGGGRSYLVELQDLTLTCDEGRGQNLVEAAMAVGAAGATISRKKFFSADGAAHKVSPARESCSMIVSPGQVEDILEALRKAGAFDDQTHGQVFASPVPKACTYLGK